jgi:prolyl 4-hydroxylase
VADALAELRRRAEAGHPVAAAYSAVLAGLGLGEPQDWAEALRRLARAAGLGSVPAQGQLQALAGRDGPDWDALAAEVDPGAWLAPVGFRALSEDPPVAQAAGFLPPAVCAWLIGRAHGRLARARMYGRDGAMAERPGRSNSAFEFAMADLDLVVLLVRARIAAALAVAPQALETTQLLHYAPGERFAPHFDFLDPAAPGLADEIAAQGQRVATFLVYLNDGYEGGATAFPQLGLECRGRGGDGLTFRNVDASGGPDRRTLHAGLPPASGEKWLLSQWVRRREASVGAFVA